jgi:hypothetical protein
MKHRSAILAVAVAALLAPLSAEAGCVSGAFSATFGQSAPVNIPITITDGVCNWSFTGGLNVTYESISIIRRPRHLTIAPRSSGYGMTIRVNRGYKGPDAFSLRACGRNRQGPGCFTVHFVATIR